MHIRDRIKELRRVKAGLLRPNPKNWRTHPKAQRDALRGLLAEVGWAGALLARQLPDGTLELVDGHLRAEITPDAEVPVLILDVTQAEADKLLATLDPLAALAEANQESLDRLVAEVETENEAVRRLLDQMLEEPERPVEQAEQLPPEVPVPEAFQVVVDCEDEDRQREVFERMTAEGYKCRLLTL